MAKEINLVPDIKDEFIKALKFRNFVFFLCIVVASASTVVILIFLSIAGGQQGFINAKQNTIKLLEEKITSYSDLSDFLTVRDQLSNIASITENKVLMSRVFNVLSALIPTGADTVSISELTVSLVSEEEENPTFTFDAQADAGNPPYIDYNVLNAFKKSMQYMRYDYGDYVDKNDQVIPTYCMIEKGTDGSILRDTSKGYYAYWLIEGEGCNPSATDEEESEDESEDTEDYTDTDNENEDENDNASPWLQSGSQTQNLQSGNQSLLSNNNLTTPSTTATTDTVSQTSPEELKQKTGYEITQYEGQNVVQIWRTPQYADWYKSNPGDDEAYMDLDGTIHNIPHFNSSCIKYAGTEKEDGIVWTATNDECKLVPDGSDGITTKDSSNGRATEGGSLVLRFNATISLAPEAFDFNNHHLIALSPSGYRNVTDSYTQIQSIFVQRASDCGKNDTECATTPISGDSSNNNNSNSSNNNNDNNQYEEEGEEEEEEEW